MRLRVWLERQWCQRGLPAALHRGLWGLGLLSVAGLPVLGWMVWQHELALRQREAQQLQQRARAEQLAREALPALPSADFTAALPERHDAALLLKDLQRYGQEAGLQIKTLAQSRTPASDSHLGRLQLSLSVQGNYIALMRWLRSAQQRFPEMTLHSLQLRQALGSTAALSAVPSGPVLESSVQLVFWSRPLPDGAPSAVGAFGKGGGT